MQGYLKPVRLNKYLAECGICSRRKADLLIEQGRVKVNGRIAQIGQTVLPHIDKVEVDGKLIFPPRDKLYVIYHKPRGVICSLGNEHNSLKGLIRVIGRRVFPAGRLDVDAEGLLLLTDDGQLAYRLTHPKYKVDKEYVVWIDRPVKRQKLLKVLSEGVKVDGRLVRVKELQLIGPRKLGIVICVGMKHVVKKIVNYGLGARVNRLIRIRIGPLRLDELPAGSWRELTASELRAVKRAVGLDIKSRIIS